jgi:outer membrane protein assembly factor BamA
VFKIELRRRLFGDFALTSFADAGNVFFSSKEVRDFDEKETVLNAGQTTTPARIEDNVPYQFEDILTRPEYIWTKNYAAYGLALNYLTPLGSINLSYGLPWKRCADDSQSCIERGKQEKFWLLNGVAHFNIGATF